MDYRLMNIKETISWAEFLIYFKLSDKNMKWFWNLTKSSSIRFYCYLNIVYKKIISQAHVTMPIKALKLMFTRNYNDGMLDKRI